MKIPFVDLTRSFDKKEMMNAIESLVSTGSFVYTNHISLLEEELQSYLGVKHAVTVSSGTQALEIALKTLGIKPGQKVLVQSNSFIASAFAISNCGGVPLFSDVSLITCNLEYDKVRKQIEENPDLFAIIIVHMYGQPTSSLDDIISFAQRKGVFVIEDCAQAFGASIDSVFVGTKSDIGCFSAYPTKPLGCFGNGGFLTTNNDDWAYKAKGHRSYGFVEKKYESSFVATNANMDSIQAEILRINLKNEAKNRASRNEVAEAYYHYLFEKFKLSDFIDIQDTFSLNKILHAYHLFPIFTTYNDKFTELQIRDMLFEYLKYKGIGVAIHYPIPIHKQKAYSEYNHLTLKNVEYNANACLSLPMFAGMRDDEVLYVCENIRDFFKDEIDK